MKGFIVDMISRGHEPDVLTYSTLIDGSHKKCEIEKAMNLQRALMREANV